MRPGRAFAAVAEIGAVGKILALAGEAPPGLPSPLKTLEPQLLQDALVLPLSLHGSYLGRLVLVAPSADAPESGAWGVDPALECMGRFLARTLEEFMLRECIRRALGEETLEQYRELALMQRAVVNLNSSMKLQDVQTSLLDECRSAGFPADYAMVFRKNGAVPLCLPLRPFLPPPPDIAPLARSLLLKDIVANGKGEILNDPGTDPRWQNEVPAFLSLLIAPLYGSSITLGALVLAGLDAVAPFQAVHLKKVSTLASVAGIAMANAYHFEQIQNILMDLIRSMATAIDARDRMTAGHSQRVAQLSLGLARAASVDQALLPDIHFDDTDLLEIFYAGLLHDIGKIGVREEVLTKSTRLPEAHFQIIAIRMALWGQTRGIDWIPELEHLQRINKAYDVNAADVSLIERFSAERLELAGASITILDADERERLLTPRGNLTREEFQEIKRHPEESFRILQNIPFSSYFPNMLTIILQHHERLDGSGYPHGATGADIILQSRIMAIVDVYDALRQDRHYKKALPMDQAMGILHKEAELGKLDDRLVHLFDREIEHIEASLAAGDTLLPSFEVS